MVVTKNTVVTLNYIATDNARQVIDEGTEPIVYIHGGYGSIFEKIEEALEGKSVGDRFSVALLPDEAFGEYEEELVEIAARDELPADIEIGMQFQQGDEDDAPLYIITEILEDRVVLDANHPLAGIEMVFSGKIENIREATKEEIKEERPLSA